MVYDQQILSVFKEQVVAGRLGQELVEGILSGGGIYRDSIRKCSFPDYYDQLLSDLSTILRIIPFYPPSLNPSHQGREAVLLPLDGGGRVGVKYNR